MPSVTGMPTAKPAAARMRASCKNYEIEVAVGVADGLESGVFGKMIRDIACEDLITDDHADHESENHAGAEREPDRCIRPPEPLLARDDLVFRQNIHVASRPRTVDCNSRCTCFASVPDLRRTMPRSTSASGSIPGAVYGFRIHSAKVRSLTTSVPSVPKSKPSSKPLPTRVIVAAREFGFDALGQLAEHGFAGVIASDRGAGDSCGRRVPCRGRLVSPNR